MLGGEIRPFHGQLGERLIMRKELDKVYDYRGEDEIYNNWLANRCFRSEPDELKKPYTIVIPPPNVTGQLHIGHALNLTLQDVLIRMKRMQGYNALWLPGTDHASISTEVIIVNKMAEEGITKKDLGRERYLKRAWEWKERYGGRILEQFQKLGCSCDWERERFTMDEGLSNAVTEVFVRLYEKGYIYRGERLVNWCPKCRTSVSDAEVDHEDKKSFFWHLKYKLTDCDDHLVFATTRPETMLGDTAVAVNPNDPRYAKYVGKYVTVPVVNRIIPVIADEYVDIETGTGVVKITPAHDPNDFIVGERHGFPRVNIMNTDGTMNENAGKYAGMTTLMCRERLVEEFKELGLFVKVESMEHAVGVHERCGEIIEPLLSLQWFVKMEEMAKPALDAYISGELNIVPERFGKIYRNWLENIRDWCISRQLWWGHRIPAYYCGVCGEITVSRTRPDACIHCGSDELTQDEDVLDTWFSSALWPFSTLGWPEETPELKYYYPTDVLVTAYEIIFFWVVRMVFSALEQTGQLPFKDVLIHGLVRDEFGKKMSKSSGNGIDPIEVIEKYGADALRLSLVIGTTPGNDSRMHLEKVELCRNFLNKIWNAARFIEMAGGGSAGADDADPTPADRWILSKVNNLIKVVTANVENYEMGFAAQKIYDFYWDEFCDWYIEMVKPRLYGADDPTRGAAVNTLKKVLITALKLLHPFMPFITEKIYSSYAADGESIMLSDWPVYDGAHDYPDDEREIELMKEAVRGIRNIRTRMNVAPAKKISAFVVSENEDVRGVFMRSESFFKTLASLGELTVGAEIIGDITSSVPAVIPGGVIYLPLAELVDAQKEIERLERERDKYSNEIKRAESKLNNPGFTSKAPDKIIEEERGKLDKYAQMFSETESQLEKLRNIRQ